MAGHRRWRRLRQTGTSAREELFRRVGDLELAPSAALQDDVLGRLHLKFLGDFQRVEWVQVDGVALGVAQPHDARERLNRLLEGHRLFELDPLGRRLRLDRQVQLLEREWHGLVGARAVGFGTPSPASHRAGRPAAAVARAWSGAVSVRVSDAWWRGLRGSRRVRQGGIGRRRGGGLRLPARGLHPSQLVPGIVVAPVDRQQRPEPALRLVEPEQALGDVGQRLERDHVFAVQARARV